MRTERKKAQSRWCNMKLRCYDESQRWKYPTYAGCEVCEEWMHDSSAFIDWHNNQTYRQDGWELDKDFLAPSMPGKLYSPETCCYLPGWVNALFVDRAALRGAYPLGVTLKHITQSGGERFEVQISRGYADGYSDSIAYCDNPIEGYSEYLIAKSEWVVEQIGRLYSLVPTELADRVNEGANRQLDKLWADLAVYSEFGGQCATVDRNV